MKEKEIFNEKRTESAKDISEKYDLTEVALFLMNLNFGQKSIDIVDRFSAIADA